MEEMHVVTRQLSFEYLYLVPAVAVLFNIYLAVRGKWTELAVFNIGGLANLAIEVVMERTGTRHFSTDSGQYRFLAAICLAWVTNGFVFSLAYINVKQWMKKVYPAELVVTANIAYFILLPLAMVDWGFIEGGIETWREMGNMVTYIEPVALVVLASAIWFLGYRSLLLKLLFVGFCIDLGFEGSLFLTGVRPLEQFDLLKVGGRVLFEMNTFLCLSFLVLKGIYGLEEYRDAAPGGSND